MRMRGERVTASPRRVRRSALRLTASGAACIATTPAVSGPSEIIDVNASVFGSTTRRHKWRPGKSAFSVAAKLPMSSSSRTSSERWRDSSKAV